MSDGTLTALATALLVLVGLAQVIVLVSQKKQARIALISEYRKLWNDYKNYWGKVIFISRNPIEYYQVVDEQVISQLKEKTSKANVSEPTIWALESVQRIFGLLGEVATRTLQGHLRVSDVYPIFGTEFLRHSRPLRLLLDSVYIPVYGQEELDDKHSKVRTEMQDWLIYHDGLRRRCLILIDLLWAEAARLEDLPPSDMKSAADAKKNTGKLNRKRVFHEVYRINGLSKICLALKLSWFLKKAEYYSTRNIFGIKKSRLLYLEENWVKRLLDRHN